MPPWRQGGREAPGLHGCTQVEVSRRNGLFGCERGQAMPMMKAFTGIEMVLEESQKQRPEDGTKCHVTWPWCAGP